METEETVPIHHGTQHPELGSAVTMTAPDGDSAALQHAAIMLIL